MLLRHAARPGPVERRAGCPGRTGVTVQSRPSYGRRAPAGTRALNYAFDITPAELVSAVVTEERLIRPG